MIIRHCDVYSGGTHALGVRCGRRRASVLVEGAECHTVVPAAGRAKVLRGSLESQTIGVCLVTVTQYRANVLSCRRSGAILWIIVNIHELRTALNSMLTIRNRLGGKTIHPLVVNLERMSRPPVSEDIVATFARLPERQRFNAHETHCCVRGIGVSDAAPYDELTHTRCGSDWGSAVSGIAQGRRTVRSCGLPVNC
jgi:hypothetical protein